MKSNFLSCREREAMQPNRKLCGAFVAAKGTQCQKRTLPGCKYCWWHYPKGGSVFVLVAGTLIGLLLPLLFNEPLASFLSRHTPLRYLDNLPPLIETMVPDVRRNPEFARNTKSFSVLCSESGSGLNYSKSTIELFRANGASFQGVAGELYKQGSELVYSPNHYCPVKNP